MGCGRSGCRVVEVVLGPQFRGNWIPTYFGIELVVQESRTGEPPGAARSTSGMSTRAINRRAEKTATQHRAIL
jgi:hypothetical protein